jgi:TonB family protein
MNSKYTNINSDNITIGGGTIIEPTASIRGLNGNAKNIVIGDNCYIGHNVQIICDDFELGDYSKIHHDCNIHGYKPCKIGHNLWMGQFTIVDCIGGCFIGNNCGIGAHSQLWSHIKYGDTLEGCRFNSEKSIEIGKNSMLTRIKPKYIESIEVLKGEKATDKYGEKGKNGVVNITLIDKEKAMNDLFTESELKARRNELQSPTDSKKEIFVAVDNPPEIIGGQKALFNELEYPKECNEAGVQGRVIIQFVVTKQGNVQNSEVVRGIGSGCDQAAINAVSAMKFKPGKQGGEAVNTRFSLPIMFKLPKDNTSGQK